MKYVRFLAEGKTRYGIVEGERIREISGDIFGNTVEVRIEKINTLRNYVKKKI